MRKTWRSSEFKQTHAFIILCGSNQGLMQSKVLGRKSPLYGRRTIQIQLKQLGFLEAAQMLPGLEPQELFRFYGCFGGVPYYLDLVDSAASLMENLEQLYFSAMGFLYDEPLGLLRQELSEPALYNSILRAVASGANRTNEIADRTGIAATTLPRYLSTLIDLDILERAVPFGEARDTSKHGIYRMKDACFDFWFHFVMPATSSIESGLGAAAVRRITDDRLSTYLGHRFERLCAEWLNTAARAGKLPIAATEVTSWWGTNPAKRAADDIDVLAADREAHELIIGECKYRTTFDATAELRDLDSKCDLIKGYHAQYLYLFSRFDLSGALGTSWTMRDDVRLVSLDDMYAGV